ncbi:uncharacterized protein LOC130677948 [Microplitis mediator]|uniref:uncharacterized protein LOC130677948 n=1 Tax=Microplitis mediator TaxID=375433 RepID=UPI0025543C28|nr:uncharacterized protein LOC130677948 [Microplitis mediator]
MNFLNGIKNIRVNFFFLICAINLTKSLDLHSLESIDEIINFVTETSEYLDFYFIDTAAEELDDLEIDGTKYYSEIIEKYFLSVPHEKVTDKEINDLNNLISIVDGLWEQFGREDLEGYKKNNFRSISLNSLQRILNNLYLDYVGNTKFSELPRRIGKDERPSMCEITMNDQVRLRKLHQVVILTELRGFILTLKGLNEGESPEKAVARAIIHSDQYLLASRSGYVSTADVFRRCDPQKHIRGETFTEFLGLFQGIIANQKQINSGSECSQACSVPENSRIDRCYEMFWIHNTYCNLKECRGRVIDCQPMGGNVTACELDETSDRRIEWAVVHERIEKPTYEDHMMFIRSIRVKRRKQKKKLLPDTCNGKVTTFDDNDAELTYCHNCRCVCVEEDGKSSALRTISLRPQLADIKNNMVITGVKFVEKDRLIHIQIEQAKLDRSGDIELGTEQWKELEDFEYSDAFEGSFKLKNGGNQSLVEKEDYIFITVDYRTINIDSLRTPDGQVLVGVRLAFNPETEAIELEILGAPFDYETGKLEEPVNFNGQGPLNWITWENNPYPSGDYKGGYRREVKLDNSDEPLKGPDKNMPSPYFNQKLKIRATSYELDLAQHTIPYLDIQPVIYPGIKVPLRGLDIVHRAQKGYGGFLALRLCAYDFTGHVKYEMTQSDYDKFKADFDDDIFVKIRIKSE